MHDRSSIIVKFLFLYLSRFSQENRKHSSYCSRENVNINIYLVRYWKLKMKKKKKLKFYRNCKFCTESSYWSLRWGKQRKAAKVGLALWGTDVSLLVHEELGGWLKQSWDSDLRGKSCRFLDASVSKSMWCTGSRNDRETES